ncbi:apoptosis-enhancing nuclease [Cyprinodon tularosa]|uniref:apoptosis-enhancing nuclease n=1 Tax=Cyprinodon tularosa TaxID=77115 RepID=UPI0018E27773|nr:apoptosis-enhancing nuclease [Cyprinodon tularosa]XP_038132056.1 apoptosis-enhancing nuclease [Cyprinodon tularosa]
MMSHPSKRNPASSSRGLLGNYRYLCKKTKLIRSMEHSRARKKPQDMRMVSNRKTKLSSFPSEALDANTPMKKAKLADPDLQCQSTISSASEPDHHSVVTALRDSWEVDSGFSESSPPASGRSSPCLASGSASVVALDCEMVGTGPGGRCNELARCSIVDYQGNILYDKYVRPCQPVTNFRTPWSGIRRHHLHNATPFAQAREEILAILEGKVVVGHSVYNDFEVLNMDHPGHMVRDTSSTRLLSRLAGLPRGRCSSLKLLANKLLNRRIQAGRRGHCSVEDAQAALDLYKLVEGEWEEEMERRMRDDDEAAPQEPAFLSSDHYMQDEFWPDEVLTDGL